MFVFKTQFSIKHDFLRKLNKTEQGLGNRKASSQERPGLGPGARRAPSLHISRPVLSQGSGKQTELPVCGGVEHGLQQISF